MALTGEPDLQSRQSSLSGGSVRGFSSVRIVVKIGTFPSSSIKILSEEGTD